MNEQDELRSKTREQAKRLNDLGWYHSMEAPGIGKIQGLQSTEQLRERLRQFPIPDDLRGKRVLDIGAWDGWFSFEMERRGARVVAIDNSEHHSLREAKALLNSSVEYVTADICRVTPKELGYFDYVLFFGVLYHLKHPLLALENVCELATEAAFVESYVSDTAVFPEQRASMEFYEGEELAGQFDNWFGPNIACLEGMCRAAGFARVEFQSVLVNRAHISCYRKWKTRAAGSTEGVAEDLVIVSAENAGSHSADFIGSHDEYLNIWFRSNEDGLNRGNVFPEIGPYASQPVHVSKVSGGGYMLNCKLPPGLARTSHVVSLATSEGRSANTARIYIGPRPSASDKSSREEGGPVSIQTVADGVNWSRDEIAIGSRGGFISLWARNFPGDRAPGDVALECEGSVFPASFVSHRTPDGLTQVNVPLPANFPGGSALFRVMVDGSERARFEIKVALA